MPEETRQQHYVPRFYLREFTDPATVNRKGGKVWCYPLDTHVWRMQRPVNIATERDYYTGVDRETGERDTTLDGALQIVETVSAPAIRRAIADQTLSNSDRFAICMFVVTMMARVPSRIEPLAEFMAETGRKLLDQYYQRFSENPDELAAFIERAKKTVPNLGDDEELAKMKPEQFNPIHYEVTGSTVGAAAAGLQATSQFLPALLTKEWVLVRSFDRNFFITSDSPFCRARGIDPNGGNERLELTLPLGRNVCLLIKDGPNQVIRGYVPRDDAAQIANTNSRTAATATRFLAAPCMDFPGHAELAPPPAPPEPPQNR